MPKISLTMPIGIGRISIFKILFRFLQIASLASLCLFARSESCISAEPVLINADERIVTGHVTDFAGVGIPGAMVEWGNNAQRFSNREFVVTDADGFYKINFKARKGPNRLAAYSPGFYVANNSLPKISNNGKTWNFVLLRTPTEGHLISGVVVDEQGKPIPGVRVEARTPILGINSRFSTATGRDYFPGPDRVVTTDKQGRFSIADLPTNEVQLNLRSKHRHVNDRNYPVEAGLTVEMRGSGKPGVLQGELVDATTGLPLQAVKETYIVRRHSPDRYRCVGEEGQFRLPGEVTLGDKYIVYVYAKGYAATEAKLAAVSLDSEEYPRIKLIQQPTLRGKLIDADTDEPITDAFMLYGVADEARYFEWSTFHRYTDGYHSLKFVQHNSSGERGEFWFAEPEEGARGTIVVFTEGYERLMLGPESRQLDEASGDLVVRLNRESVFTGMVTKDSKPLANVTVSIRGKSENDFNHMYESVRTDEEGKYRIGRLRPGQYFVSGGPYSRKAEVGKAETKKLNLGEELGPIRIFGKTSPKITIMMTPVFDWEYYRFTTVASETGKYEFSGLRPGKYVVHRYFSTGSRFSRDKKTEIEVKTDNQEFNLLPQRPKKVAK